ncbi:hypothetical protein HPB47_013540 [Ixodes persulcatus]|uniref:Uncharacterized protein n=1 Tax=Ixodes persulcatus TaxID=34615 RepID=A0AC60QY86_IXOPE|nr:hypothetical protein HPB47_013540 [Ixodes persulcatus]
MMLWRIILALLLTVPLSSLAVCSSGPVVSTTTGEVRGFRRVLLGDRGVDCFTGIPYGRAPMGQRRFRRPEPSEPWNNTLDTTRLAPACLQTPAVDAKKLLFQDTKSVLAASGDVAVTINYRLGAFGFLYGETEDVPGNQGLYDQALALTWVINNVDRFNGNPDSTTLFGESSGASSVVFHLLSPMTQFMVHRAIVQSGGVDRRDLVGKDSDMLDRANKLAEFLGCSGGAHSTGELSADTVNCIRATNASELSVIERLLIDGKNTFFQPIFGDAFMPVEPRQATFPGDKDVLIGQGSHQDVQERRKMSSIECSSTALKGLVSERVAESSQDCRMILPRLPSATDFKEALFLIIERKDLLGLGPCQLSRVWMATFANGAAKCNVKACEELQLLGNTSQTADDSELIMDVEEVEKVDTSPEDSPDVYSREVELNLDDPEPRATEQIKIVDNGARSTQNWPQSPGSVDPTNKGKDTRKQHLQTPKTLGDVAKDASHCKKVKLSSTEEQPIRD